MSGSTAPSTNLDDDVRIRRILIATDFSEASSTALRLGSDLGHAFDAELSVVHVLPDADVHPSVEGALGMKPGDLLERRVGEAEAGCGASKRRWVADTTPLYDAARRLPKYSGWPRRPA